MRDLLRHNSALDFICSGKSKGAGSGSLDMLKKKTKETTKDNHFQYTLFSISPYDLMNFYK